MFYSVRKPARSVSFDSNWMIWTMIMLNNIFHPLDLIVILNISVPISSRKSGGISVCVKKTLSTEMCIHRTASKYVLWFSFNKMLHRDKNVLFGAVYIPPQGSKYSDINYFDEIETELVDPHQNIIYDVCLLGDFNSRTENENDFISLDSDLIDDTRISGEFASALNAENELKNLGFSQERTSMDKGINQYGRRFLDFCKTNTLYIVNGRIGEDRYHGRVTCKGNSTVDYMVASHGSYLHVYYSFQ